MLLCYNCCCVVVGVVVVVVVVIAVFVSVSALIAVVVVVAVVVVMGFDVVFFCICLSCCPFCRWAHRIPLRLAAICSVPSYHSPVASSPITPAINAAASKRISEDKTAAIMLSFPRGQLDFLGPPIVEEDEGDVVARCVFVLGAASCSLPG